MNRLTLLEQSVNDENRYLNKRFSKDANKISLLIKCSQHGLWLTMYTNCTKI